ncbi:MAG: dipeptide epimerase [Aliishimia sp.]
MLTRSKLHIKYDVQYKTLAETFKTARVTMDSFPVVVVTLERNGVRGRGECYASTRFGWDTDKVLEALKNLPPDFSHAGLLDLMEAGPARNAVDCAFWDLSAKESSRRAWFGLPDADLRPVETMTTISLMSSQDLERQIPKIQNMQFMKLKVGGPDDLEVVRLVRKVSPDAKLLIDANEGWSADLYATLVPELQKYEILMIEQPLKEVDDHALANLPRPIAICADESFHAESNLEEMRSRYDAINIKLDKMGGLTAALQVQNKAKALGFQTVVGCMLGTSLAIAPGLVAAQQADYADLDAHLLCKADRQPALRTTKGVIHAPDRALWG